MKIKYEHDGKVETFRSVEEAVNKTGLYKYDIINALNDRNKRNPELNLQFSYSREYKLNDTGTEVVIRTPIPGVRAFDEEIGVEIKYTDMMGKHHRFYSILEASEKTGLSPGGIMNALRGINNLKNAFWLGTYNEFCHYTENGAEDFTIYSASFDVEKIDPNNLGSDTLVSIRKDCLDLMSALGLSPWEVNNDSRLYYIDEEGYQDTHTSIKEVSDNFRIHIVEILRAVSGTGPCADRFTLCESRSHPYK